jgi:metal-responsive CopG/Arc/MetJ family transcriptional regulator
MAQSGKPRTYSDVIESLVSQAILLSPELVKHVDEFIEANKHMGYVTREELIREAVDEKLRRPSTPKEVDE